MPRMRIDGRRIGRLKPRNNAWTVRDTELKGFGVRILPSGTMTYFLQTTRDGIRRWYRIGDAAILDADEARTRAAALLNRGAGTDDMAATDGPLFEHVAAETFAHYRTHWKPRTLAVNRNYCDKHILPRFAGRPVAAIERRDVLDWFASLHDVPTTANRTLSLLSVVMRQAEVYGYRPEDSNPCLGIARHRRPGRERFLSPDEIRRLAAVLDRHECTRPGPTAAVRLLLLTGCRKSELLTLRWSDYRDGRLFLRDSKTGPRTVWLSSAARAILDRLPRDGAWVFPSRVRGKDHRSSVKEFWQAARSEAGLHGVRLHDLRHTYASTALAHGETVPVIGRLLGHRHAATTLRYTKFADAAARTAVETVGTVLGST